MQIALIPENDSFTITPVGLVIKGKPTIEDVQEGLTAAWHLIEFGKWAQIDLLCYAHERMGEDFASLIDVYHYAPGTVGNMLRLGYNVPASIRVEGMSVAHHQEVAGTRFTLEERERWLKLAEKERWNRDELRAAICGLLPGEMDSGPPIPVNFESATRMMIDWLDGKISYSREELKEVLREFLRRMER